MSKVQYITYSNKPNKVDFFYMKPLYKQQQQVQVPEQEGKNVHEHAISLFSHDSIRKSSSKTLDNKPTSNILSEVVSIQSSFFQFQKIKRKYLDDYLFICNLGKGTYGRVQKLKSKLKGQLYAGKILHKSYQASTNKYKNKKLQQQIKIYSQISHSNIPQLHQIYSWKNEYTIIMQFVKGQNLHSVLDNHPNQQQKIAKIIFQILDGLQYLHSQNIVHHDLKPQNIMYDEESGIVKIVDFGESIQLQSETQIIQNQGGTWAYFPPQYFENICSPKMDIWALGVITYYLLEGKLYFNDPSKQGMKKNILKKQVEFTSFDWSIRSQKSKDLILKMLQKNPQKRITAQEAKKHQWIQQNCRDWNNPSKNIFKKLLRPKSSLGKRSNSYDKQINCKESRQRKNSYDLHKIFQRTSYKQKISRFNNK